MPCADIVTNHHIVPQDPVCLTLLVLDQQRTINELRQEIVRLITETPYGAVAVERLMADTYEDFPEDAAIPLDTLP